MGKPSSSIVCRQIGLYLYACARTWSFFLPTKLCILIFRRYIWRCPAGSKVWLRLVEVLQDMVLQLYMITSVLFQHVGIFRLSLDSRDDNEEEVRPDLAKEKGGQLTA